MIRDVVEEEKDVEEDVKIEIGFYKVLNYLCVVI